MTKVVVVASTVLAVYLGLCFVLLGGIWAIATGSLGALIVVAAVAVACNRVLKRDEALHGPPVDPYAESTPAQRADIHARALAFATEHPTRSRVYQAIAMVVGLGLFLWLPLMLVWAWLGH